MVDQSKTVEDRIMKFSLGTVAPSF